MQHYFGIVYTKGDMNAHEVYREMKPEHIVPILVMKFEGQTIVPLFTAPNVAEQFAKRNLPKKTVVGTMNVLAEDGQFIDQKGWKCIIYEFPKKVKDLVEFDVELLETDVERIYSSDSHAYSILNS